MSSSIQVFLLPCPRSARTLSPVVLVASCPEPIELRQSAVIWRQLGLVEPFSFCQFEVVHVVVGAALLAIGDEVS